MLKKRLKYYSYALLSVMAGVVIWSCTNNGNHSPTPTDSCEVEIKLVANIATRSVATDEAAIHTVDVLVFDGKEVSKENATFAYSRTAWSTDDGNTYRVVLQKADTVDVYFAVNASAVVSAAALAKGTKWSDARKQLLLTNPEKYVTDMPTKGIPMWGQKTDVHIDTEATYNHWGSIKLLRAMASAEVKVTAANFRLVAGYVANGANLGYLPYDVAKLDATYKATTPFVPATMEPTQGNDGNWKYTLQADETAIAGVFYLLENGDTQANTKIIVEGRWANSTKPNGVNTFYPLAFHTPDNPLAKRAVTRNTKFIINITNVNADGYDSFDDARNGEEVNMAYTVVEWDENSPAEGFIEGPNSLYIDPRRSDVQLGRAIGSTAELRFVTDFDLTKMRMKLIDGTDEENELLDTHTRFRIERKERKDRAGQPYNCFLITTKKVYEDAAIDNPVRFIIDVDGRLNFEIKATQIDGSNDDWNSGYPVNTEVGE